MLAKNLGGTFMEKPQVVEVVRKNKGGTIYECYGPSSLNGLEVWEIWVTKREVFETRFVVANDSGDTYYFDDFRAFIMHVDGIYDEIVTDRDKAMESVEHKHHTELVRLYLAAFLLIIFSAACVYCIIHERTTEMFVIIFGIVASAGTLVFGTWKNFTAVDSKGALPKEIFIQK
ncbi:MAG: hypothetical protein V4673_18840 [Pseudomonadota bacterium]